jgi:hypothetical protein
MEAAQGQQHVAAGGKERDIPLAEQHHRPPGRHRGRQAIGGLPPGRSAGLRLRRHREKQGQALLMGGDPGGRDGGRHAAVAGARHRIGHHRRGGQGPHRGHGEQFGIAGTHPNQGEGGTGRGGGGERQGRGHAGPEFGPF